MFFGTRTGSDGFGMICIFHVNEDDPDAEFQDLVWNAPAKVDDTRRVFKDFYHPIPSIIDRIPEGTLRRYVNVAGAELDHWTFGGRVTLLGDAAHTHGGAHAAGASIAINDAFTLYLAPRAVFAEALPVPEPVSRDRIAEALRLYEAARKPHVGRVMKEVHAGRESTARGYQAIKETGVAETDEALRARLRNRSDAVWLNEHDAEEAFRRLLEREIPRGNENPESS